MGQVLSPVSTEQNSKPCENLCSSNSCPFETFFSCSHRHSWSSTVQSGLLLFINHDRQDYALARSSSFIFNFHGGLRKSLYLLLGLKIRSSGNINFRQRVSVFLLSMDWSLSGPWNLYLSNHKLSSTIKWMIECFHRSLKSSLRARAADSDWVSHLPLVLLGLRSVLKEDTGFSVSEAVYPLTIPGEFLDAPEIPSSQFISKVEKVIAGFSTPPPHHVQHSPPVEIPAALKTAKFVFVREDASKPSLSPLYRGPYLVIELVPDWYQSRLSFYRPSKTSDI